MDHPADVPVITEDVRRLLQQRYSESPESAGIALAAAAETADEERALDELASAWHASRIQEGRAAAGLSGAIAEVAQRLSEDEIMARTGVPLETVRALGGRAEPLIKDRR